MYYIITPTNKDLQHHGILGQKWGTRNGPPYPLTAGAHSSSEKSAGWKKSLSSASYGSGYQKKKKLNVNKYERETRQFRNKYNDIKNKAKDSMEKDRKINKLEDRYNRKMSKKYSREDIETLNDQLLKKQYEEYKRDGDEFIKQYNDIKNKARDSEEKDRKLNKLEDDYKKKMEQKYDKFYLDKFIEMSTNEENKKKQEKQKQVSEKLNIAKTEGKYELTFLEAVQNSDIANRGDEKSKKALLKEYEAYLNDRENYWDRARGLKEWQGNDSVSSETYGSPFSKKNSKSANPQSPQKGTTEYESQKQDALQKGKASDVLNFRGDLTNQQLQYAVDRIRLENTLSDYSSKETSTTWSKVNNVMNNVNTVNNWANIALNSANTAERVYNKLFPDEKKKS